MTEPVVSVVIATVNGIPCLERCLAGFPERAESSELEVLVVERSGASLGEALRSRWPWIEVVTAARAELPAMRALGLRLARGVRVAVLADRFVPEPGWAKALLEESKDERHLIGGPVLARAEMGSADRATFLCEYAPFMPPVIAGPALEVPDNNVSYPRRWLGAIADRLEEGAWNGFLHEGLRREGASLRTDPALRVSVGRPQSWSDALRDRYHHGRAWSAHRLAHASPAQRVSYAILTAAVPLLLLARLTRTLTRKRRLGGLATALPGVLLLLSTGAIGEASGALRGRGRSLEQLR